MKLILSALALLGCAGLAHSHRTCVGDNDDCPDFHTHLAFDVINYSWIEDPNETNLDFSRNYCGDSITTYSCAIVVYRNCRDNHSNLSSHCNTDDLSPVNVDFRTQDITAEAGKDYTAMDRAIVLSSDAPNVTVPTTLLNDDLLEYTERFRIFLAAPEWVDESSTDALPSLATASIGQMTILDSDKTTVSLEFSDVHKSYKLRGVAVATYPFEKEGIGRQTKILESEGPVNLEIRIGPNLIVYGHSFVAKTRFGGNALEYNPEALEFTSDLSVHLQCPESSYSFPQKPLSEYEPGDEDKCGIVTHGTDSGDFVIYDETEMVGALQTAHAVAIELKNDDLPERYHTTESLRFSSEVFYVDLLRNGVEDDVRSGNTLVDIHIIDDDPAFVVTETAADIVGDSVLVPVSLAYKLPVDATVNWGWYDSDKRLINAGLLGFPAGTVRRYVEIDDSSPEDGRHLQLIANYGGAVRVDPDLDPHMVPPSGGTVLGTKDVGGDQVTTLMDYADTMPYAFTQRNPVFILPEDGSELEWEAGSVEIPVNLGRVARDYFSLDYQLEIGGVLDRKYRLSFQPGSPYRIIRWYASKDEAVGAELKIHLSNLTKGWVVGGEDGFVDAATFAYAVLDRSTPPPPTNTGRPIPRPIVDDPNRSYHATTVAWCNQKSYQCPVINDPGYSVGCWRYPGNEEFSPVYYLGNRGPFVC